MVNSRKCCNRCKRRRADEFFEADAGICTVCVPELAPTALLVGEIEGYRNLMKF